MAVVITGHVDHGKSTVVGRLLADTGSLPDGKLEQVRALCERTGKPFEYAFLVDALIEERAQGITIDAARVFFRTDARDYVLLDAPGHVEFLKNMITGASRAEAAVLVVDAREGIRESSKRHATMLSMLGVRQVVVLVNKMDAVSYDEAAYVALIAELKVLLDSLKLYPSTYIPVSAREGDNLAERSARMPWYTGPTFLAQLDAFAVEPAPAAAALRMPVQDVYKFVARGDERRIVAGTIDGGTIHVGDELVFYPSEKRAHVATIEAFGSPALQSIQAGHATGFTLIEPVYVARGELATRADEAPPVVGTRFDVSLFWLGRAPLSIGREYVFKLGTARTIARLEKVLSVIDASSLAVVEKAQVERNEVAECILTLRDPVACDLASESAKTSRFVLVDAFTIAGGGIIREALPAVAEPATRSLSAVREDARKQRFGHRAGLVVVTGPRPEPCEALVTAVEERVFASGGQAYALGLPMNATREQVERLAETSRAMLDAGTLLFVAAPSLSAADVEALTRGGDPRRVTVVWAGEDAALDLPIDVVARGDAAAAQGAVLDHLARAGVLPKP